MKVVWPKRELIWVEGSTGYISVPFTWNLPRVRQTVTQLYHSIDRWIVGGPAVKLMPDYLDHVEIVDELPGVLQRVNPLATRTTLGCTFNCSFCGVDRIEGCFKELDDWPNLPIICDNNVLAASESHFQRVVDRLLSKWDWCDFNQGIDARLLTAGHAQQIARIKEPMIRLALDSDGLRAAWVRALELLLKAGIAKHRIRSYALVGFSGSVEADRERCSFIQSFKIKALPMWYTPLDAMQMNQVTNRQASMGWTYLGRREFMRDYYVRHGYKAGE